MKKKKIYIAGSGSGESYGEIAKLIALALSEGNYELIITTTLQEQWTFEEYVLAEINTLLKNNGTSAAGDDTNGAQTINQSTSSYQVIHYESESDATFRKRYDHIKFIKKRVKGNRQSVIIEAINASDCILLLGGKRTVELIGQLSIIMGKSMIPIPWLRLAEFEDTNNSESSSDRLWKEYGDRFDQVSTGIIDNMVISGKVVPSNPLVGEFVSLINSVIKNKPFEQKRKKGVSSAVALLTTVVLSLGGWYLLYISGSNLAVNSINIDVSKIDGMGKFCVTLYSFLCIPISVFLGTVLRVGSFIDVRVVLIEISKSLIVSFGLVLIYMYAGFLASGNVPTPYAGHFERVTINLSILGLLSGMLLQQAETVLKDRLTSFLDKETEFKS
ncbi:MAG: hypothetical protein R8G66_09840 [Cytophagales bacterium]|nr:hypothetical protein [Cytophagales bacterium]